MKNVPGTVYLLHFDTPYKHAKHYVGWVNGEGLDARLEAHRKGTGARLMQVIKDAGIGFSVARTWENRTRKYERSLKNSGGASRYCPICKGKNTLPI